jgi:hypothetical protein
MMWMLANAFGLVVTLVSTAACGVEGSCEGWVRCSVRCWVLREHVSVSSGRKRQGSARLRTAGLRSGRRGQWWWGVWLFFENCTVDASIFVASY